MRNRISRRRFVGATTAALTGAFAGLHAIEPISRINPFIKGASLAAYSFRDQLNWFKGKQTDGSMDLFGFLDYCAEQQLLGAELTAYFFPEPVTPELISELKRRAHILGLDITGGAIGNNFSFFPGSSEAKQQAEYVHRWIDTYADLGAPVIRVFAGHQGPEGATEEQVVSNIKANLTEALIHAERRGVILAMENHDSMSDVHRLLDLVKSVQSKNFGVTWDSGNIIPTPDPYADLALIAPYAVNAQIKVMIPVNGVKKPADFTRLIKILRDANYGGYVVLEYEEQEDPFKVLPAYIKELRAAIG